VKPSLETHMTKIDQAIWWLLSIDYRCREPLHQAYRESDQRDYELMTGWVDYCDNGGIMPEDCWLFDFSGHQSRARTAEMRRAAGYVEFA
jgi:hypothetical protein